MFKNAQQMVTVILKVRFCDEMKQDSDEAKVYITCKPVNLSIIHLNMPTTKWQHRKYFYCEECSRIERYEQNCLSSRTVRNEVHSYH